MWAAGTPWRLTTPAWEERVRFKSTVEFVQLMDDFIDRLPQLAFRLKTTSTRTGLGTRGVDSGRVDVYKRFP